MLRRVGRGFYVPSTAGPPTVGQRIADVAPIARAGVIAGWAAGYIHRAHWLDGRDRLTFQPLPVDCIGPRRVQQPTVRYRLTRLSDSDICIRREMRVTTPLRTAFDGARWASSLEDAVAFVDAMAKFPLLNVPLFDGEIFLGQPDLFDPDAAFAMEFDGDLHRDREQHRRDNVREEKLESAGVTVARGGSLDLTRHRGDLIRRMQDGHRRGMSRNRARDRWTIVQPAWWRQR